MTQERTELAVKGTIITMRFDNVTLARVDEWRKAQPEKPKRSASIRWLVNKALEAKP